MRSRWELPLFALFMSLIMSAAIALVLPLLNGGWSAGFVESWAGGTALGFLVSFPLALLVVPTVRGVVEALLDRGP